MYKKYVKQIENANAWTLLRFAASFMEKFYGFLTVSVTQTGEWFTLQQFSQKKKWRQIDAREGAPGWCKIFIKNFQFMFVNHCLVVTCQK